MHVLGSEEKGWERKDKKGATEEDPAEAPGRGEGWKEEDRIYVALKD